MVALSLLVFASGIWFSAKMCEARQLPELYSLEDKKFLVARAQDYNVLVEHVRELERKVAGMQNQITVLHARQRAMVK